MPAIESSTTALANIGKMYRNYINLDIFLKLHFLIYRTGKQNQRQEITAHPNSREQKKESKFALLEVAGEGIEPPAFGL